ncbi:hypothetical protein KJ359_007199 [Pestalotiopsis sp. 9143b]|nr:hypothetical protein KJ359_007199 [Pestalotiopsis sp. 9143b]
MQLTTSAITLLALAGVEAMPGSEARQATAGAIIIGWYADGTCSGTPLSTDTIPKPATGGCFELHEPAGANHFRVLSNTAQSNARIFNVTGCNESSTHFDIHFDENQECSACSNAKSLLWL